MKRTGRFVAPILLAVFVFLPQGFGSASAADAVDEQWFRTSSGEIGYQGIIVNDALNRGTKVDIFSLLQAHFDSPPGDYVCSATNSTNCAGAFEYNYFAILPPCATAESKDCISGLSAYRDGLLLGEGAYKETLYPDHPNSFRGIHQCRYPNRVNQVSGVSQQVPIPREAITSSALVLMGKRVQRARSLPRRSLPIFMRLRRLISRVVQMNRAVSVNMEFRVISEVKILKAPLFRD